MKLFIAIGGVVVALLMAALVAPYFIDWTAYRTAFETESERILGHPVKVRGEASARLLPFPSLTFTDVTIGREGAGEISVTLESFRMDAELAPYLSGEIRIFQMELGKPHLVLPYGAGSTSPQIPASLDGGANVVLENILVTDGSISLQNGTNGQRRELKSINASLSARTLRGPFAGGGTLVSGGEALQFQLSSGVVETGGHWPFRLTLTSNRLAASFAFDGSTELGDGGTDFAGNFEMLSPAAGMPLSDTLPPVRATSKIAFASSEAQLTDVRVEVGKGERPYVLKGQGQILLGSIPHFDLALDGEQVDVDAIAGQTLDEGVVPTFANRVEALRSTLAAVPPVPIPGQVTLALPVVTIGDTVLRGISVVGSPSVEGWGVSDFRAELPGRTLVEAEGFISARERLSFRGDMLVASRHPAGLVSWLGGDAGSSLSQMTRAGFSARVELAPERQLLDALEVDVGGQILSGRVEQILQAGGNALSADLSGEAVDLNSFNSFAKLFTGESVLSNAYNVLDIRFNAGPVALDGQSAQRLEVDLTKSHDILDLQTLVVENLGGANLEARGTIANLAAAPQPDLAFDITMDGPSDLGRVLQQFAPQWPVAQTVAAKLGAQTPLALTGTLSSSEEPGLFEAAVSGQAAGTDISVNATIDPDASKRQRLAVSLGDANALELLQQFGFAGFDIGLPSPLQISLNLDGAPDQAQTAMTVLAPDFSFSAQGPTRWNANGFVEGTLQTKLQTADLSPWLTAAGVAFVQGLDAVSADVSATLASSAEGWSISEASGQLGDVQISAADLTREAAMPVRGSIAVSGLSLPWLATMVYGVEPTGNPWPDTALGTSLLSQLPEFAISMTAGKLWIDAQTELSDVTAQIAGSTSSLQFGDVAGTYAGGQVAGAATFSNSSGFGTLEFDVTAQNIALPQDAAVTGLVSGQLAGRASGQTYQEMVGSITGGGEASIQNAGFTGFNPPELVTLLGHADAQEFQSAAQGIDVLAATSTAAPRTLAQVSFPLKLALGTAMAGPFRQVVETETLTGQASLKLADWSATASLGVIYQPPEGEFTGDAIPSLTYGLSGSQNDHFAVADVSPLASYISQRAYNNEQIRVQDMRDDLQETLRLRREARYFEGLNRQREAEEEARQQQLLEQEALRRAAISAQRQEAAPVPLPAPDIQTVPPEPAPQAETAEPFRYDLPDLNLPESYDGLPGVNPTLQ
ncbi:hypothetical protein FPY71_05875 [Aureimonas fodinaquatilis]|uniref:AsmA family protein n=1 Tax=Aureimonas fodinaquatilis TaxID=2565783 RepID=A0A5B0E2P7_9HYPH|nr:hypothetical protein [Aureimonas fodinaquatilis]KAA0972602.1 hypothetical protein FPY71_05875 [Aureimonas fodinaquatilis]